MKEADLMNHSWGPILATAAQITAASDGNGALGEARCSKLRVWLDAQQRQNSTHRSLRILSLRVAPPALSNCPELRRKCAIRWEIEPSEQPANF